MREATGGVPDPQPGKDRANRPERVARSPALVPHGGRFQGLVVFQGEAAVEGEVVGNIVADGCLRLGPSGRVRGEIGVDNLVVAGAVEGHVRVRGLTRLECSALIRGRLETRVLKMADGSVLEGSCRVEPSGEGFADEAISDSTLP